MSDLKISMELRKKMNEKVSLSVHIYGGYFNNSHVLIFTHPLNKMLKIEKNLSNISVSRISDSFTDRNKIVGNNGNIFSLRDGYLSSYRYIKNNYDNCYKWVKYENLNFKNILAISEYEECFACLGLTESKRKELKIFEPQCLPNFEDYTFNELNDNDSEDYYLKAVEQSFKKVSLLVSDNSTGNIYLCSGIGKSSLIYCSKSPLISAISIVSEDCLSIWFESGKVFFHYFSQVCVNNVLFLNERVVCVEKCFCNDSCFLWSSLSDLHHTQINFVNGNVEMTNFKVQNNIPGVISLIKLGDFIMARTINEDLYEISQSSKERKEIIKPNAEVLSQIYNESLKIKETQNHLEVGSECMMFREMMQKNQMNVTLNHGNNFLMIKNKSGMTFKKEFWKIEIALFGRGLRSVKIVELEADLANERVMKIKNPFPDGEKTKVYLTGRYDLEMLSFCIGVILGEGRNRNNLKEMLNSVKLKKDTEDC